MDSDGSKLRRVASGKVWDVLWSPDGTKLALSLDTSRRDSCGPDVIAFVSVAGGVVSALVRLPTWDASGLHPYAFSPDGSTLLYHAERNIGGDCRWGQGDYVDGEL